MEKYSDTYKNGQTVESSSLEGRAQRSSGFSRTAHQEEAHTSVPCGAVATEMKTWNSQLVDTPIKNQVTMLLLHAKQAHTNFFMEGDRLLEQFSFMLAIKCFTFGTEVQSSAYSSTGLEFASQHQCQATHKLLKVQFQRS